MAYIIQWTPGLFADGHRNRAANRTLWRTQDAFSTRQYWCTIDDAGYWCDWRGSEHKKDAVRFATIAEAQAEDIFTGPRVAVQGLIPEYGNQEEFDRHICLVEVEEGKP